jgi:hypothetical protein
MNEAVYCRNGHFIGYIPERDGRWDMSPVMHDYQERQIRDKLDRLAFCPNCGAPGVKGCLGCKRTIERDPRDTLGWTGCWATLVGMDTAQLLSSIDSEIATLREVRSLLAGQDGSVRSGRKPGKKRTMSASARARIAAAQKKRWAAWKKAQKP